MSKLRLLKTFSAFALICASAISTAATVEFTWDDPAKFRDIEETNGSEARFQTRVIKELEEQFTRQAEKLPADQTLHVTVHDVDLAGFVEYFHPGFPFGLRVVRNIDFPTIDLSYELKDANDAVIKSGTQELKDLGFRSTSTVNSLNRDPFRYEHQLIKDWYNSEFAADAV
jgi:DUF3016 family protein